MRNFSLLLFQSHFLPMTASEKKKFCMNRFHFSAWACVFFFALKPPQADATISRDGLEQAAAYSARHGGISLLVIQGGRVVTEDYPNGGSAKSANKIYSGTKSFFSVAALIACQEGLFDLDDPVSSVIQEWKSDPKRQKITIRQLLNFTSGLGASFQLHSDRVRDRNAAALSVPLVAERGEVFTYGPSHGQVLCEVLTRKLSARGETPYSYLKRRILDPLGIGDIEYRKDQKGAPLVASGFRLTARQWARFGMMLLENGSYRGRRIVSPDLVAEAFRGSPANPMFGFGLWINQAAKKNGAREVDIEEELEDDWNNQRWNGGCISRVAPPDLVAAVGSENQRLYVIPSLNLVVVRHGTAAKFSDAEFLRRLLRPQG